MWQSDHTLLGILVVGTDGKPARPWLTTILDDCSRAICGYTAFLGGSLGDEHRAGATAGEADPAVGLEKHFSHYPQFYSRVGFAHQYRPLVIGVT